MRKWCYEMWWSGEARLAYGDGVSCGAGAVQVVAHGFVRAQQEVCVVCESVLYSKLAMCRPQAVLIADG